MNFQRCIQEGYSFESPSFTLGTAMRNKTPVQGVKVRIPFSTLNRHGLIAGATGTGKTKTLQIITEQLSLRGIGVLLMDFKGDLSGLGVPGTTNKHVAYRHQMMEEPWQARDFPVELLSLSTQEGVKLRATIAEFGPILFAKMIGANDTQEGILSILFAYCNDQKLPLLDLKDLKKVLQFISTKTGKAALEEAYGAVNSSSIGAIMRKIVALESQGADLFFGEKSFEVQDLLRKDNTGNGYINILRLTDIQNKPALFSTFMLGLLSEIYQKFPEEGDLEQPKLVMFIDEAHLVFKEASKVLLGQIETIIKLIRSKGVGIFFCTQNPTDIPESVLGQLGLKVQHALRAFTAKDRKSIKMVAENYPFTDFYQVSEDITQLGIGEAFVTALNEKGIPTPLAHVLLRSPSSRMDVLTEIERTSLIKNSVLVKKYSEVLDRDSAYELLNKKMQHYQQEKDNKEKTKPAPNTSKQKSKSVFQEFINHTTTRQIGRTIARELTRSLLNILGLGRRK